MKSFLPFLAFAFLVATIVLMNFTRKIKKATTSSNMASTPASGSARKTEVER
jgi:preprotein translocase subunit SecG